MSTTENNNRRKLCLSGQLKQSKYTGENNSWRHVDLKEEEINRYFTSAHGNRYKYRLL